VSNMPIRIRRFVPVYQRPLDGGGFKITMAARTFETEEGARTIPRGPFIPIGLEVIAVIPVTHTIKK
jgi:hypothetical protein